jgi:hypothetical protein
VRRGRGDVRRRGGSGPAAGPSASRTVTVRRDGRAVEDSTVIRAVVHARLLGLRLLTLDARVVVAPATAREPDLAAFEAPAGFGPVAVPNEDSPPSRRREPAARISGSGRGVGTARLLLAEGADALAEMQQPPRSRAVS